MVSTCKNFAGFLEMSKGVMTKHFKAITKPKHLPIGNDAFISPYATSHLWEDWAKTWAHYMRMIDTLKTTCSFGIDIKRAEMKTLSIMIPTSYQILTI